MAFLDETGLKELVAKIKSTYAAKTHYHAASAITSGTLSVARGGTGAATLTDGAALIGNGTSAIETRSITNMTSKNYIASSTGLITANTLAYWNGAYNSSHASNLTYCNQGAFSKVAAGYTGTLTGVSFVIKSTNLDVTTAPDAATYTSPLITVDSNGNRASLFQVYQKASSKVIYTTIGTSVTKSSGSGYYSNSITLSLDNDGNNGGVSISHPATWRSALKITSGTSSPSSSGSAGAIYIKYSS